MTPILAGKLETILFTRHSTTCGSRSVTSLINSRSSRFAVDIRLTHQLHRGFSRTRCPVCARGANCDGSVIHHTRSSSPSPLMSAAAAFWPTAPGTTGRPCSGGRQSSLLGIVGGPTCKTTTNATSATNNSRTEIFAFSGRRYRDGDRTVIGPAARNRNQLTSGRLYAKSEMKNAAVMNNATNKPTSRTIELMVISCTLRLSAVRPLRCCQSQVAW